MSYIDQFEQDFQAHADVDINEWTTWLTARARHYAATADRLRDAINQVDDALQRGPLSRDRLEQIVMKALT